MQTPAVVSVISKLVKSRKRLQISEMRMVNRLLGLPIIQFIVVKKFSVRLQENFCNSAEVFL